MLTPFQRHDLDLLSDSAFQATTRSVSHDLANHVTRISAAADEAEMVENKLDETNEQLIQALERFAEEPGVETTKRRRASQLAERIRSELQAAERP